MTRHEARQRALQALYQIDVGKADVMPAIVHVLEDTTVSDADLSFIQKLVQGTQHHVNEIDEILEKNVQGWNMDRIARVELNVLRMALYELMHESDVDVATILDEAVELAKEYSTDASGKFVNGVLARLLPLVESVRKGE